MKKFFSNILSLKYVLLAIAAVLLLFSYIFNSYFSGDTLVAREKKSLEQYVYRQEKEAQQLLADTSLLRKLLLKRETEKEFDDLAAKKLGLYLMEENEYGFYETTFWSNPIADAPYKNSDEIDGETFEKLANGYYIKIRQSFSLTGINKRIIAYVLIPVFYDYYLETDYLPPRFAYSSKAFERIMISKNNSGIPVNSISGKTLFLINKKTYGAIPYNDAVTILLRISAILLVVFFIYLLAESFAVRNNEWWAVIIFIGLLLLLRIGLYFFPHILNLRQFELFDPSIYGSNFVNKSLGDLLINAVFFSWIALFAWNKLPDPKRGLKVLNGIWKWVASIGLLYFLIISTFILANLIRGLIADSKISFDVTDFFSLTIYSVIGFVILGCISLGYYYFSQILFRFILPVFEKRTILIYFLIALTGLVYLTFRSGDPVIQFYLPVLLWLVVYIWLVSQQGFIINRLHVNISGLLFWIFIFSISISAIIINQNEKKELVLRKGMAEKLSQQKDEYAEKTIRTALTYLDNDFLVHNLDRFRNPDSSQILRDSIINESFAGYINKYETKIYVFDSTHAGLNNDASTSYNTLNNITSVQAEPSELIPGLYYYETSFDKYSYITKKEITDSLNHSLGTVYIVSTPKRYSSDALFPELFRQKKQNTPENSSIYSYAIYSNKNLTSSSNKYPFAISLTDTEIPVKEVEERMNGDFDELWYKASTEKIVVIARKKESVIEAITLFSYIFCTFLFLLSIVQLFSHVLKFIYNKEHWKKFWEMNIRTQVHSTVIFISILSFIVIGIATISFFISRYDRNNQDKLSRTMKIMENEMEKKMAEHSAFDDVIKIYDTVSNEDLKKLVEDVSEIHNVDVNIYDLKGNLMVSSEPEIYRNGVLSSKMNPIAFYHLNRLRQVQHVQDETVGTLKYTSIYAPVRKPDGSADAYLNIPYFTSENDLNQEISNFLVTTINLNAFIFLIAGVIALFIANRITRSFSVISDKMKEVNLGKLNEEIQWTRNDEIGELVKEYNKMVAKLGESAVALAKSEREGAWREMARQVAHEIKNPLTPMKLSIQYLQKAIDGNQPNVKELSGRVANTLVEQIDHLSKIAADFSQFANIGNAEAEVFDLHDVISSLKDLYRPNYKVSFIWNPLPGKLMLIADKTHMNRLFTNLFSNAVEACDDRDDCVIEVNEAVLNNLVRISVSDNGTGIPAEKQSRIFDPNFTTKTSGTGLGLAMCKSIVEKARGRIWFETKEGAGTTFIVELPLESH